MTVLIGTAICLLVFGLWYAKLEYDRPVQPTYWAVIVGVGVTMIGQTTMVIVSYFLDYGPPGLIVGIALPFALTGLPMAIAQERKERLFTDEANNGHA